MAAGAPPTLNGFLARGPPAWAAARTRLQQLLGDPAHRGNVEPWLVPRAEVTLHLPIEVADYVDFYSSQQHAENVGRIFRPGSPPLTPNWKHLPIGYHGRAGTVAVSDTPVVRPRGQRKAPTEGMYWTPAQQLARLTVNGASLRTGDLLASDTVSGPEGNQRGSFLELSWSGPEPVQLPGGVTRTFGEDDDTVTLTATAPGPDGTRIGFGEVRGRVFPAR